MEVRSLYLEPDAQAADAAPALEAVDVFKIFRAGPVETVALRGLSLRIESGELVAILGPSGSGKSTFLQLAAGLAEPSAGEIRIDGEPLTGRSDGDLAFHRARRVAIVFQDGNLWPALSAGANVRLAARLAGRRLDSRGARSALAAVGLEAAASRRPHQLSGGEQQRVALVAAAVREPMLVLADEPTGELDATNEQLVIDGLRRLRAERGCTIVVVTHSERLAETADRIVELRDGAAAGL